MPDESDIGVIDTESYQPPLMRSSARGYEPMTVWLLEAGAPALCKDRDGNTRTILVRMIIGHDNALLR